MRPFVKHYDLIYSDKDYGKDVGILHELVNKNTRPKILEIGSGTGNQSILLSRWADVTAVETDADFAEIFRSKNIPARLFEKDIAELPENDFDGAAAFFHVVNYIQDAKGLAHFFTHIARRLKAGSVFLFDMWHGECAMQDPPRPETRIKEIKNGRVTQAIAPILDKTTRRVTLSYHIQIEKDGIEPAPFNEKITLHLWQQDEIIQALQMAGFSDIIFFDGKKYPARATPESWALWITARKS